MRIKNVISIFAVGRNEMIVIRKWAFYAYLSWSICADLFLISGLIYYFFW